MEIAGLSRAFGRNYALRDVSFKVGGGEVVALLGENGAGKSTLIKILAGVHRPTAGSIEISGRSFDQGISAAEAHEAGLAFVHQDLGLLGELTVAENIAHAIGFSRRFGLIEWGAQHRRAEAILKRWEIDIDPATRVDQLEGPERALVAIARALATEARIIVLDEPTAALPRHNCETLFQAIDRLSEGGVAVLYVTHRLTEVERLADRAVILRDGRLVAEVAIPDTSQDELVRHIVGHSIESSAGSAPTRTPGSERLKLEGVGGKRVSDVSLSLRSGEIVALVGLIGAGQREVGRIVAGVESREAGEISLAGEGYVPRNPREAQRLGVTYIPGDRIHEASFPSFSTAANYTLRARPALRFLRGDADSREARPVLTAGDVRPASPTIPFAALSGGNQQKVIVAKWMADKPAVLVADDPTAGVDVGAREEIHQRLRDAAAAGASVLLVSADADEVASVADRAYVFREGRVGAQLAKSDLAVDRIALECNRD